MLPRWTGVYTMEQAFGVNFTLFIIKTKYYYIVLWYTFDVMSTTQKQKVRRPYKGIRKFHNFTVDYSMDRLIFTVDTGKDKIQWQVNKEYVRAYPNFAKISDYELWEHYVYHVLPQIKQYYEFMEQYYSNSIREEPPVVKTPDVKSYV